jgi:uncharacterized protein YeaO (DUF488 family)
MIRLARVYDPDGGGRRYLVERLWPRGVRRDSLRMEAWLPEVGPSAELRQWFGHDPRRWAEFQRRYSAELDDRPDAWRSLLDALAEGDVTLLYSSRDREHNNAVALAAYLRQRAREAGLAATDDVAGSPT